MSEQRSSFLAEPSVWRSARHAAPGAHRNVVVQALLRDRAGRMLLTRSPRTGGWQLPSAVLGPASTPAQALRGLLRSVGARDGQARLVAIDCGRHRRRRPTALTLLVDAGTVDQVDPASAGSLSFHAPGHARLLDRRSRGRLVAGARALAAGGRPALLRDGRPRALGCAHASALHRAGLLWQLSDRALVVDPTAEYPLTVYAADAREVVLDADADTTKPIAFGLVCPDGHAELTAEVRPAGDGRVVRVVDRVTRGTVTAGAPAYVDTQVFDGDPRTALGLDFTEVTVNGPLGPLPAWHVPAAGGRADRPWVICVHGHRAGRAEALRALPAVVAAGCPALVITYRNDAGAPASPDGLCHLGDTEWHDLVAAVEFAVRHGATAVVPYGWSMGGMLALLALRRCDDRVRRLVRGLVIDSPVLSWAETLAAAASRFPAAPAATQAAMRLIEHRLGTALSDLDAGAPAVPTLLFVDLADRTVPPAPALRYARSRPDLVRLMTTEVGHCRSWNQDPARYAAALREFLTGLS